MRNNGELSGICILHVDDFLLGGNTYFFSLVESKLIGRFTFGKIEVENFKFTGLNIQQTQEGILVDQNEYIQSIKPIKNDKSADKNTKLSNDKFALYRAFDTQSLSTKNKEATYKDLYDANKVLKKAQLQKNVKLKFQKLGKLHDLKIVAFTDSSYRNSENKEKSVGGRYVDLSNKKCKCVPLFWKSKTIPQVCKSVKTAETRSLERGMEDSIYLAKIIQEIYSSNSQIPVDVSIDSKTLFDSLNSTRQIDEKTVRHLIAWNKQQRGEEKTVQKIKWISAAYQLADCFTKKNVKTDDILRVFTRGNLILD